jgi:hypothetical protein
MFGLLFGALAGGLAAYYWHDNIREYMSSRVPDLRQRAAEGLGTLGERAGGALDRARARIDTGVRTGQERLRSSAAGSGSEANQPSGYTTVHDVRRASGPSGGGERQSQ